MSSARGGWCIGGALGVVALGVPSLAGGCLLGRSLTGCSSSVPFLQRWSVRGITLPARTGVAVAVLEAGQLLGGTWPVQRNGLLGTQQRALLGLYARPVEEGAQGLSSSAGQHGPCLHRFFSQDGPDEHWGKIVIFYWPQKASTAKQRLAARCPQGN